jgi:hypothetical protein
MLWNNECIDGLDFGSIFNPTKKCAEDQSLEEYVIRVN